MTHEEIKQEFERRKPLYEQLANNIVDALKQFLKERSIDYVEITHRIKDFESFRQKIERKSCKEPLKDITDICGIRVIYYYDSDTAAVDEIIESEFEIVESEKKSSQQEQSSFGYRSNHFIVKVPQNWLSAPNYRGLKDFNAEIQTRTILMHSWAAISHKLSYKQESDVPKEFQRSLFRLSALIELADQQFDILRKEREKYSESLVRNTANGSTFDVSTPLNVDSLITFSNFLFPQREGASADVYRELLNELTIAEVNFKDIAEAYRIALPFLAQIEEEYNEQFGDWFEDEGESRWNQIGAIRSMLSCACPKYLAHRRLSMTQEDITLDNFRKWLMKLCPNAIKGF